MRFINLGELSLSNDELSSLSRIHYDSFSEMITRGVYIDYHPAGLQAFLFYWVKIFGDTPFILRFPFVICSLVSVWLIYKIGKSWFNGISGLFAAASFGFLSLTILFTQLARMYSPGIMFTLLSAYAWTNFLFRDSNTKRNYWLITWTISMIANIHLHYFSFFISGVIGISGFFFVKKRDLINYSLAGVIAVLTFIPEIPIFREQMKTGDIGGWLGPPSKYFLPEFFYELFNRSVIICLLIILILIAGIFLNKRSAKYNRYRLLSLSWFSMTFIVAYSYSILRHPIITFSTMLFSTPFVLLSFFSFLPETFTRQKYIFPMTIIFSLIVIYDTTVPAKHYSKQHFGVFREIAYDANEWTKKYGNLNIVANVINPDYIDYYFKQMNPVPKVTAYKIETTGDFTKLFNIAKTSGTSYFAYIWSNSLHPFEISEIIRTYYPYMIDKKNYFNASAYLFSKQQRDSAIDTLLYNSSSDYEHKLWPVNPGVISTEQHHSGEFSEKMTNEYSATFRMKASDIPGTGFRYVSFKAWIYPSTELKNAQLVLSFDRNGKPYDYHSVMLGEFNLKPGNWQPVIVATEIPKDLNPDDMLVSYIWNHSKENFYADDLSISIFKGDDPYAQFFNWKRNLFY
jgi:hypothetical protein